MTPTIINSGEPVTLAMIREWERSHRLTLPEDYVAFLLKHNGGKFPGRGSHLYRMREEMEEGWVGAFRYFFPLTLEYPEFSPDLNKVLRDEENGESWVPIAQDECGLIFLILGRAGLTPVDIINRSLSDDGYRIADSFSEFLTSFEPDESPDPWETQPFAQAIELGNLSEIGRVCAHRPANDWSRLPDGRLALAVASQYARPEVADLLLRFGAGSAVDADGQPPIIRPILYGETDIVRLLLAHGADPNSRTKFDESALMAAIKYCPSNVHLQCVLIEAGADVGFTNQFGETPLTSCIYMQWNQEGTVRRLIRHGAKPAESIPMLLKMARLQEPRRWNPQRGHNELPMHPLLPVRVLEALNAQPELRLLASEGIKEAQEALSKMNRDKRRP